MGISFGVSLVVGVAGRLVLGGRSRRLARQAVVVVLVAIAGTMLGAVVAAKAMFVSPHDLKALFVILVGAGIVAVLAALHLGEEVDRASRALGDVTRGIGADEAARPTVASSAPEELTRLAHELDTMGQRLDEARAREQRVEQSRRELIAWVSHDLRTPLAGIRAMVEALNDGVVDDPETVERYLATIQREADRLAALVDDLFELSRIQADALRLSFEPIALAELVSDTLASAQVTAERKGVRLQGHVLDDAGVADLSIPEMGRVLRNLLENAIRHTPPGGTITVEVVGTHRRRRGVGGRRLRWHPERRPRSGLRARLSGRRCSFPRRWRRARPGDREGSGRGPSRGADGAERRRRLLLRRAPAPLGVTEPPADGRQTSGLARDRDQVVETDGSWCVHVRPHPQGAAVVAGEALVDVEVTVQLRLRASDHRAADARLVRYECSRAHVHGAPAPPVLDPTVGVDVDQEVGPEPAHLPRPVGVERGAGSEARRRQHQERRGVHEAAGGHGPLDGSAGVIRGVGEELGLPAGRADGSDERDGPLEPVGEGGVGLGPRPATAVTRGQHDGGLVVVAERRGGQEQLRLAAPGEDPARGLVPNDAGLIAPSPHHFSPAAYLAHIGSEPAPPYGHVAVREGGSGSEQRISRRHRGPRRPWTSSRRSERDSLRSSAPTGERRGAPHPGAAVAAALLSGLLVLVATRRGPLLSPDSITYLSAAQHLRAGRGLTDFTGRPLAVFGPLYPVLLSVGGRNLLWARLVGAAAATVATALMIVLLRRRVPLSAALLGGAAFAASQGLVSVASTAWSESPYLAIALGMVVVLTTEPLTPRRAAIGGLLAGRGFLTRYAGAGLIVTGAVIVGVASLGRDRRIVARHLGRYGATAVGMSAVSMARNTWTDGAPLGPASAGAPTNRSGR